jgi:uracil-DNA glycosylase
MHFHAGNNLTAFVFSAPGAREKLSGLPVTGDTGTNLEDGLVWLARARPDVFPSTARYDYRITNAFAKPLAKSLGDKRTEASHAEILTSANVARLLIELQGMRHVVLCGKRPGFLKPALAAAGLKVLSATHTGNQALNSIFKVSPTTSPTAADRRAVRVHTWAQAVLSELDRSAHP